MGTAVDWVVFDLNGTVLDPSAIGAELPAPLDRPGSSLDLLDDSIAQAMTDTVVGRYRPFPDYLRAAILRRLRLAGITADQDRVEAALAASARLPAYPEVPGALRLLRQAGLRIAAITNSPTRSAESALRAAELEPEFEAVLGSDQVRTYKPAPTVYRTGLDMFGAEPARACMIAAHGWDLHGAKAVGMRTGWVARKEGQLLDTVSTPDFTGDDVAEVSARLVERQR